MMYKLRDINQMGISSKDHEMIEECINIKADAGMKNPDIIIYRGGAVDDVVNAHIVNRHMGKESMGYIPAERVEGIAQSGKVSKEVIDTTIQYLDEAASESKKLSDNVLVINAFPYYFQSNDHMSCMLSIKDIIEKQGGKVVFAVKALDEKLKHKLKLEYDLNTITVSFDYISFCTKMYEKVFKYTPDEKMVQIIANAVKMVCGLSVEAIKREIEYLYDACAAEGQCMPGLELARKLLKVEGEKCYKEMLDNLVGLEGPKQKLTNLVKAFIVSKRLKEEEDIYGLRLALSGEPGTGKSTLIKIIVEMLRQKGALDDGSAYKILSARELIGSAIGHSEDKLKKLVAENDVIVLDEIGAMCSGSDGRTDSFTEAVNKLLVYYMEADGTKGKHFIFIGYPDEIKSYIEEDSGLKSRIRDIIQLEDYGPDELVSIAEQFMKQERLKLENPVQIHKMLENFVSETKSAGMNARDMRNLVDYIKEGAYVRCFDENLSLDDGVEIGSEDVQKGIEAFDKKYNLATKKSRHIGFTRTNKNQAMAG